MAVESLGQDVRRFVDYLALIAPAISTSNDAKKLWLESSILLLVAWHEELLGTLAVTAAHERESQLRSWLAAEVDIDEDKREKILRADRRELIVRAKHKLDLKKAGARITRFGIEVWQFDPWPSEECKHDLIDLNLIRQIIAHHDGGDVGDGYWNQLSRKDLLRTSEYPGLPPVRQLDHEHCIVFMKSAVASLLRQAIHVQTKLRALP
jgi:hypothetical protein